MNKLEKYIKDNCIDGSVVKNLGSWVLYYDGDSYPLASTIPEAIKKVEELFPEDQKNDRIDLQHCRRSLDKFTPKPNRFFEVNEDVNYGGYEEVKVEAIYDCGVIYKLSALNSKKYGIREPSRQTIFRDWMSIYKKNDSTDFSTQDRFPTVISNTALSDLFSKYFHFGLELSPDYQRGNVWNERDKEALLDSIFNHIKIGTFCFNRRGYGEDKLYEVIDGKQRTTTLIDYRLDKFRYRGKLWSELSRRDRGHIRNYNISTISLQEATQEEIYSYFLKLNTGGRLQDPEHISYVQGLLDRLEEIK